MQALAVRRKEDLVGRDRIREVRLCMVETATDGVPRRWFRHRRMNSKKPSCGASGANWNKRAWPALATRRRCSKSFEGRIRWDATIPAHADQGRNIRSATARRPSQNRWAARVLRSLARSFLLALRDDHSLPRAIR